MKNASLLLLLGALALAGCASQYVITPTRGNPVTAKGKPRYDKATDAYIFTGDDGRQYSIRKASVREIAPASMSSTPATAPVKVSPGR